MIQNFPHIYKSKKTISVFCLWKKWFFSKKVVLLGLPKDQWKLHIMQLHFNHVVKNYEYCWSLMLLLVSMLCENFKEKKIKIVFVVNYPKFLYSQQMLFRALGIKRPEIYKGGTRGRTIGVPNWPSNTSNMMFTLRWCSRA